MVGSQVMHKFNVIDNVKVIVSIYAPQGMNENCHCFILSPVFTIIAFNFCQFGGSIALHE